MSKYADTYEPWRESPAISAVETFHEATKLRFPFLSTSDQGPALSLAEQQISSRSFRESEGLPSIRLTADGTATAFEELLLTRRSKRDLTGPVSISQLSRLLIRSAGMTGAIPSECGTFGYGLRAWPSAGGLYPLEIYISARQSPTLKGGVYHFRPLREDLVILPQADQAKIQGDGFFQQEFLRLASVVILIVAVLGRITAKYGDRGYRLALLDAGHLAQNLVLEAAHIGLPCVPIAGFADDVLAQALGIDGIDEVVLHSIALGGDHAHPV